MKIFSLETFHSKSLFLSLMASRGKGMNKRESFSHKIKFNSLCADCDKASFYPIVVGDKVFYNLQQLQFLHRDLFLCYCFSVQSLD